MNYLQLITLACGLIAAVLGIYFAETPPYTHFAATAVIVATVIGIFQAVQAEREAAFIRETLSHLARSVPSSDWWRKKVNSLVQQVGRSQDLLLDRIVYDRSDFHDPEACSIFLFRSPTATGARPNGLLVLTPADYAELSLLRRDELKSAVTGLLLSESVGESLDEFAGRISEVSAALYSVPRVGQGFKVALQINESSKAFVVTVGQVQLAFDTTAVQALLKLRPVERDLQIAREIEKFDVGLARYLRG